MSIGQSLVVWALNNQDKLRITARLATLAFYGILLCIAAVLMTEFESTYARIAICFGFFALTFFFQMTAIASLLTDVYSADDDGGDE